VGISGPGVKYFSLGGGIGRVLVSHQGANWSLAHRAPALRREALG